MHRRPATPIILAAILAASGCAASREEIFQPTLSPAISQVVFAVDGAGNFQASSKALRMTAAQERLPIQVETFEWSHGYGRILADEIAHAYAHAAGERLSATVVAFHEAHPQIAISLIGHSAGSSVILTAAESLPPDILAHIVLLAPSVSADHDLRPALRTARAGIDVYYSRRDWWYLWLSVKVIGTADGLNRTAAGNSGFRPIINGPDDAALYCKLRQHPWDPSIEWTGNHGGHYGTYRQEYLRAYVLPILTPKQFEAR